MIRSLTNYVSFFQSDPVEQEEPAEEPKEEKAATTTPPSTPVRAEEGRLARDTPGWPHSGPLGFNFQGPEGGGGTDGLPARLSWGLFMLWSNNTTLGAVFSVITGQEVLIALPR